MRLLKINNTVVDIDDQTAIGIDLQSYDVKEPGKSFIKITNTFTVPKTVNNLSIFGLASDVQSTSTKIYNKSSVDYWIENEQLVKDARCRVDEISDRISLFIFAKPDIFEELKSMKWGQFAGLMLLWLYGDKNLYAPAPLGTPYSGTFQGFVDEFGVAAGSKGIILPAAWGNLYAQPLAGTAQFVERQVGGGSPFYVHYLYSYYEDPTGSGEYKESFGGHFGIFVKTIFEFIESHFGVDFGVSQVGLQGNIWDDAVAQALFIDWKYLKIEVSGSAPNYSIYFAAQTDTSKFLPHTDIKDKEDKTVFDFVNAFFQVMNIIIDEVEVSGSKVYRLARFDGIETDADVRDYSGKISGDYTFKPIVEGYGQNNYIKFKTIFEGGEPLTNAKLLSSSNLNADVNVDLFEIDAHVCGVDTASTDSLLILSQPEAFKEFTFMAVDGATSINCYVVWFKAGVIAAANATKALPLARLYDLDSEYNFLEGIIEYPKFYEAKLWLTIEDIRDLQFFRQYFIKELNGSFFINKIRGFNPDKSNEPTTVELIRISDKTPDTLS